MKRTRPYRLVSCKDALNKANEIKKPLLGVKLKKPTGRKMLSTRGRKLGAGLNGK